MNILLWIVFGGVAGWVASLIVGADAGFGLLGNIVLGILGAFLGGWIADKTNIKPGSEGADRPTDLWSFLWAVLGAIILLFILNLIF